MLFSILCVFLVLYFSVPDLVFGPKIVSSLIQLPLIPHWAPTSVNSGSALGSTMVTWQKSGFSSSFTNSNNMILSSSSDIWNFPYLAQTNFWTLWIASGFTYIWDIIVPTYRSLHARRWFDVKSRMFFRLVCWLPEHAPRLLKVIADKHKSSERKFGFWYNVRYFAYATYNPLAF